MARKQVAALGPLVDAFILQRRVLGRSASTVNMYALWLVPLAREAKDAGGLDSVAVTKFLSRLRERNLSEHTVWQAYQCCRIFSRWLASNGHLRSNPCDALPMKPPKKLPEVPTEDEFRRVLAACPETFEGRRNRAILLVLVDSGVRRSECVNLLVQDWDPRERSLFVRQGKGKRDRVTFCGPTTARAVRDYLAARPPFERFDYLFVDRNNRPLKGRNLLQVVHRLSGRAGIPPDRRMHVHKCRHLALTSWIRADMDSSKAQRLAGHSSPSVTARYVHLVSRDAQRAHREAGAVERMMLP